MRISSIISIVTAIARQCQSAAVNADDINVSPDVVVVLETVLVVEYVTETSNQTPQTKAEPVLTSQNLPAPEATPTILEASQEKTATEVNPAPTTPNEPVQPSNKQASSEPNPPPVSTSFEDGKWPCSKFLNGIPNVQAISWLNFNGWSGIQQMNLKADLDNCIPGGYCSYACAPGWLKTQWAPYNPGQDGRTIGGLRCGDDGMLYKTEPAASELCMRGVEGISVKNTLGQGVAICQTDYPGTENMCIPTYVDAGQTSLISINDQSNYYHWKDLPISSQFYVNNAGVSKENGCIWGNPGGTDGNWAPLIFGGSRANGIVFLSITRNPNNPHGANYNVVLEGDVNSECSYVNNAFSNGQDGCTTGCSGNCWWRFY